MLHDAGHRAFSLCPRKRFNNNTVAGAVHSSHPVFKKHRPSPQRDESKQAFIRAMVISGSSTVALGANGSAVLPRFHAHNNGFDTMNFPEGCLTINKGFEFVATIE